MSTTAREGRTPPPPAPTKTGDWLGKILLACGPLSALVYIGRQPTPWIGLYERLAFSAYFVWLSVLAVVLWRRPAVKDHDEDLEDRTRAEARTGD